MPKHATFIKLLIQAVFFIFLGWPLNIFGQSKYIDPQLPEPAIFPHSDFEWIYEIVQESNEILWLATNKGLFSFDGAEFRRKPHQPKGFSAVDNNGINDLFLDHEKKQLWVAHEMGASVLDLQTDSFTNFTFIQNNPDGMVDGACESVFKDRQGNIWFGVLGFGLARLDTLLHFFPMPNVFGDEALQSFTSIHQIAQDVQNDSILWLATGWGLVRFNKETGQYDFLTNSEAEKRPAGSILTCLLPTRDKIFCANTWGEGAYYFDLDTQVFKRIEATRASERFKVAVFQAISEEEVWAYSNTNSGFIFINQMNGTHVSTLDFPKKLRLVGDGFLATPNQFWIASRDGLAMFDMNAYHVENHVIPRDDQDQPNFLRSILEKENGNNLWLGFQNTNYIYDYSRSNQNFLRLQLPKGKQGTPGGLFLKLSDNRALFISPRGIFEIHEERLKRLPALDYFATRGIVGNPIQDSKGNLWLSHRWDGLYRVDMNKGIYVNVLVDSPFSAASLTFKDSRDNIYISGNGVQVYRPDFDSVFHLAYHPEDSLTIRNPRGYVENDNGYIWMSDTRVGGLLKIHPDSLEKGVLKKYDAQNGPNSNQMRSLARDQKGRIWAVTFSGLQVFDPAKETFQLFGKEVGFRLREPIHGWPNFNPSYLTSLSTGEMLVGYVDGFAIFHPDSLGDNRELPHPYFLSIHANDRPLTPGRSFGNEGNISLPHNENLIEFEFSSIAFHEPEKIIYRYRLFGFEENWRTTTQRQVRYTYLPPGNYTFELTAVNSDGHHAASPLQWHFKILPPWWATWWAYLLYLLLTAAAAYAFYYYKKSQWKLQSQLEMEHREAERLKELDVVKTRLYTNITHEFRTPLTVILGMVKQIQNKPKEWLSEGMKMIERNGQNLLRLVNQMLDLSKLEAGALPLNMVQSDVIVFLKYLLESFHSLAEAKNIRLDFSSDPSEVVMDFDPEKLREIMSNLVTNAIKFTSEGGNIKVSVIKSTSNDSSNLDLTISDNGKGIPPEKLPFIFDRFYQADDKASRKAEGTGIGLALTKELVNFMKGEITVKSEVDKGSTFAIVLPIRREAHLKPLIYSEKTNSLSPKEDSMEMVDSLAKDDYPLLLLVEDNEDVLTYLRTFLAERYKLEEACNGREGIDKAIEIIPDFIISDVMMPEVDGFELCDTLKKDERTSHIPIILLTAKADIESRIEGLEYGADAYLAKPFDQEELLVRIKKLIELRRQLQNRYRQSLVPQRLSTTESEQKEDAFVAKVSELLKAHLDDSTFGVPQLCELLGMSRAQLYRKFNALTGQPIGQFFRELRLQKATELLLTTDLQVSEIAYNTGFKDPTYFTKSFKERYGTNPSEIRKGQA